MKRNLYDEKPNILGKLIREKRIKKKMSQNELAIKMQLIGIQIQKNDISKMELQTRLIKDYELICLKDILEFDLSTIHLDNN